MNYRWEAKRDTFSNLKIPLGSHPRRGCRKCGGTGRRQIGKVRKRARLCKCLWLKRRYHQGVN